MLLTMMKHGAEPSPLAVVRKLAEDKPDMHLDDYIDWQERVVLPREHILALLGARRHDPGSRVKMSENVISRFLPCLADDDDGY